MNRVVHFEIHAEDPLRAADFYKNIFGWQIDKWGEMDYWMVMTAPKDSLEPGINGGILPRSSKDAVGASLGAYVCTVQVENIDEVIKKINACGGTMAMEKFAMPGMAWQAYYKDTEGNVFGIHQPDTEAK